ncbi:MAG: hypothetical protein IJS03_09360 [Eubacterium sp.]|nr:hypothetical protein [Eubacterium sp.]
MNSYDVIIDSFEPDEPIFVDDIKKLFPEKSRPWIDKALKSMLDSNRIKRYDQGVYYIPRKTIFGDSKLNPNIVLTKRYINDKNNIYGYTSGITLLNKLGLTTQMSNTITIVSNKESSRGRAITVGRQKAYLMKAPCEITNQNCNVLQLLEAIRILDTSKTDETESENLRQFIKQNNITLADVSKYCEYFPDYVSKRILGGNVIGILA